MARGLKKHMKRLNAPSHWMLSKLGGIYAPRPSAGPHKLRECLPLVLILRNRLKYALTRREVLMIVMRRLVKVDGKVRTDMNYPAGFQDVVSLEKTGEHFRLVYDVKGRFVLHRINEKEAAFKLCRVQKIATGSKAVVGSNPFLNGKNSAVPYITTHDGRTVKYPDPHVRVNDTVVLDIASGKVTGYAKFDIGNIAMVTRGANTGRIGVVEHREKHPGSHEIVHLKDKRGKSFATRVENVFIIGTGNDALISLPRGKGIKYSIIEERDGKH